MEFLFEDIESCEMIGYFDDEFVYDIEVEDNSHTFIANDILVHNSLFISLNEVIKNTDYQGDPLEFLLNLYEKKLKDYFNKMLNKYAKKYNTDNLQEFELEAISEGGFYLAKKKYALSIRWTEGGISEYKGNYYPGKFYNSLEKLKLRGVEIVKKSYPKFARDALMEMVKYLFRNVNNLSMNELIVKIKNYKKEFKLQNIEDISMGSTVNEYEKYVTNDKKEISLLKGCPMHIRGAAIHNHKLYNDPTLKTKYQIIKRTNKIKYYYVKTKNKDENIFSYIPGMYPIEFAPEPDYDMNFNRVILDPINRFIGIFGKPEIPENLVILKKLF